MSKTKVSVMYPINQAIKDLEQLIENARVHGDKDGYESLLKEYQGGITTRHLNLNYIEIPTGL